MFNEYKFEATRSTKRRLPTVNISLVNSIEYVEILKIEEVILSPSNYSSVNHSSIHLPIRAFLEFLNSNIGVL